jgi:hypothetical protein
MFSMTHTTGIALLTALFAVSAVVAVQASGVLEGPSSSGTDQVDALLAIPPTDLTRLNAALGLTPDPLVRQTVVMEWVRRNQGAVPDSTLAPLCEHLADAPRTVCLRRLGSPHLSGRSFP